MNTTEIFDGAYMAMCTADKIAYLMGLVEDNAAMMKPITEALNANKDLMTDDMSARKEKSYKSTNLSVNISEPPREVDMEKIRADFERNAMVLGMWILKSDMKLTIEQLESFIKYFKTCPSGKDITISAKEKAGEYMKASNKAGRKTFTLLKRL